MEDEPYNERAWQERENSRTHSVKFTDAAEPKEDRDVIFKLFPFVFTSKLNCL